ncbi:MULTISPECIES: hypothetical protein [unclassified Streptomyces]|uniref:hypothetical protein n=1 Tax=unclassified Streptomyces TaxID=2593676 RepID=UPI0033314F3A
MLGGQCSAGPPGDGGHGPIPPVFAGMSVTVRTAAGLLGLGVHRVAALIDAGELECESGGVDRRYLTLPSVLAYRRTLR